ncbi:alternate signal-mediated exported protein [Nocardioides marinisabuli]|uniref:Alternate signal-mediated exported protein n=1 Tax=Nocardioides marinisabuli TaxID=419476 RepID=A0A7Y9JPA8_9ACTN|nr:alternate-type signal peptide domain-containing protein [Nocardioides marinisabuli]NYD56827.1 alternate signal-mediated exported protein [Nocardioides marinisabuli]
MRTSLKAALAGVAGAGLLLGGAGSLAFWNDTQTENGGTIESGTLNLLDRDCSGWVVAGSEPATTVDLLNDFLVVPGTEVSKTCTYGVKVEGVLEASLSVNDADDDGLELGPELEVTSDFSILDSVGDPSVGDAVVVTGGVGKWTFNQADTGKTLKAVITVKLPFEDGVVNNAANSLVGDGDKVALATRLDDLTVTVKQTS